MFKINGKDFSDCINRYGLIETPRRIQGQNQGMSISGTDIDDLIAIKYDVEVTVKPIRANRLKALNDELSQSYVQIQYDSGLHNGIVRRIVKPSPSSVETLTYYAQRGVFGNMTLNFTEK